MMTTLYEWYILEWDLKQHTFTINQPLFFNNHILCYRYKMDSGQIDQQLVQDIEVNWSFNECEKLVFVDNRVITLV